MFAPWKFCTLNLFPARVTASKTVHGVGKPLHFVRENMQHNIIEDATISVCPRNAYGLLRKILIYMRGIYPSGKVREKTGQCTTYMYKRYSASFSPHFWACFRQLSPDITKTAENASNTFWINGAERRIFAQYVWRDHKHPTAITGDVQLFRCLLAVLYYKGSSSHSNHLRLAYGASAQRYSANKYYTCICTCVPLT
jgi:hypothetical protein